MDAAVRNIILLGGSPGWVPVLFRQADLFISGSQINPDGTYGRAWLGKQRRDVALSSILTRTGTGGTAFNSDGSVTTFSGTALRCTDAGITTEEARQNLVTNSAVPTAGNGWTLNSCTTTVQATGPGAGLLWYLYDDGTATAQHHLSTPTVSFTSGTAYTYQALVKYGNAQYVQLTYAAGPFSGAGYVNFDLVNGTIATTGGTGAVGSIKSLGNNVYLIAITATATSTTTGVADITVVPASNSTRLASYAGNHNQFYVWNQDVTAGSFAVTPWVNTGSSVARAADALAFSDVSWGPGTRDVTLVAGYKPYAMTATGRIWDLTDGTNSNRIIHDLSGGNAPRAIATSGGTTSGSVFGSGVTANALTKSAAYFARSGGAIGLAQNGGATGTGTSTVPSASLSTIQIGQELNTTFFSGVFTFLAAFNSQITGSSLSALTQ